MEEKLLGITKTYIKNYNTELSKCNNIEEVKNVISNFEPIDIHAFNCVKKKRVKNQIECEERCQALRANKTQCTRRKKNGCIFCGTHTKGTPYGVMETNIQEQPKKIMQVFTQEIQGILYYIDNDENIYNTEDIINKITNPRKVGKYIVDNKTFIRV